MIFRPMSGKDVVDLDVVQLALRRRGGRATALAGGGMSHWPSPSVNSTSPIVIFGRDAKGLKKRSVGLRDAKVRVEDKQRLAHGIDDVQQQALGRRDAVGGAAGLLDRDILVAHHRTQARICVGLPAMARME